MINNNQGFTLIETLVAVLILATAIAGPLTLASKGLQSALIAKDQVIADYLAQDAVEYVRFLRDSNRLADNADWLAGLNGISNGHTNILGASSTCINTSCAVDSTQDEVGCTSTSCVLNYDNDNHRFTYATVGNMTPSIFYRTVIITPSVDGNDDQAQLTVAVNWSDLPGVVHTVVVRETLFNWQ